MGIVPTTGNNFFAVSHFLTAKNVLLTAKSLL
jgi:hypothetical protein